MTVIGIELEALEALLQRVVSAELDRRDGGGEQLLTREQVAQRLSISPRSIGTLVSRDGMPARVMGPKLLRFAWSEVEAWAHENGRNLAPLPSPPPRGRLRRVG